MAQINYEPPDTICAEVYSQKFGDGLKFAFNQNEMVVLAHPDGRVWKNDGGRIRLNSGSQVNLLKYYGGEVYNAAEGRVGLFQDGDSGRAIRHTGYNMYAHPFAANNYDWAWQFIYESGTYAYLFNDYGDGWYVGYDNDSDSVLIVPPGDGRIVRWGVSIIPCPKSQLKALAYMHRAQGVYDGEGEFRNVDACVLPMETLSALRIMQGYCFFSHGGSFAPLKLTKGGVLETDRQKAAEQVKGGQIYPRYGCSVSIADNHALLNSIHGTAEAIDFDNHQELNSINNFIGEHTKIVIDLRRRIREQRIKLQNAINEYFSYLNTCSYNRQMNDFYRAEIPRLKGMCNDTRLITSRTRGGYCSDVYGWSTAVGGDLVCWDCHGGNNQQWRMDHKNRIRSKHSGMCMDVEGAGTRAGTRVMQFPCHDGDNQKWDYDGSQLKPRHISSGNMCLDVWTGDGRNGQKLVIWPCHGGRNQQWDFLNYVPPPPQPPPPPPGPVTFYEHCDFQGHAVAKGPGRYDIGQMGIGNDSISSIRIPAGRRVRVYQHAGFQGAWKDFTGDVSCLVHHHMGWGRSWNDQISSFEVF